MKRLVVALGLVLVMAFSLPAAAGINTEIGGKVQTDLYYNQEDGLWAYGEVVAKITMSAGTDGAVKAVLGLGATETKSDGEFGADPGSKLTKSASVDLKIDTAYIEANGAWLEGTPEVTTKFGRFGTNYSDWVADLGNRDAIELSNIDLGPVSVAGLYAWVNGAPFGHDPLEKRFADEADRNAIIDPIKDKDWRIVALKAGADLDVVQLSGAYVSTYVPDDDTYSLNDYVISATAAPAEGLKVDATFAGTNYALPTPIGDEQGSAWKVGAEFSTIPNLTLTASIWASDDAFNPVYAKLDDKKPVAFRGWDKPNERKGVEVGASTTQAGFDISGKVARTTDANDKNEALSYEVSLKRDFGGVIGTYKYEDGDKKDYLHTITVETTVATPIISALNLKGTVRLPEGGEVEYAADATWKAPNGFSVGVHYANYDRKDDWGGRDVNKDNEGQADGFTIKVGHTIEW